MKRVVSVVEPRLFEAHEALPALRRKLSKGQRWTQKRIPLLAPAPLWTVLAPYSHAGFRLKSTVPGTAQFAQPCRQGFWQTISQSMV